MLIKFNSYSNKNNQNFGIRIKVDKNKLKNLGQTLTDNMYTTGCSGTRSGAVTTYSSVYPFQKNENNFLLNFINKQKDIIDKKLEDIKIKENNLPQIIFEKHDKELTHLSTGTSLISGGTGLSGSSIGTTMAQIVNFPVYPIPESTMNYIQNNPFQKVFYELLFNANNIGNDTASSLGTGASVTGSIFGTKGMKYTENSIDNLKKLVKNIPS